VGTVTVEITRVGEEPEIRVPMDLRKALAAAPLAQALWADITPIARRDWILWLSSAKQPETRGRLAALLGGDDKVDAMVEKTRDELRQQRTITVANAGKQDGKADFLVLLSPGSGSNAIAESAKFVSGDEKLKPLTEAIQAAKYHQTFPDETPVKIPRRGTMTCVSSGDCSLVLDLPEDVSSVD